MVYWSFVRSAMLYGSETWCLRENEMAVLRRTDRAMVQKEQARTTKEDVEEACGEGIKQKCWFGKGGCHESSEMESGG